VLFERDQSERRMRFCLCSACSSCLLLDAWPVSSFISRASFCCSNKARKLHLFSAKVAFMRCKLHLCAHLTVKDLKQPILHAKIEKVAKSNMQKSKKLRKLHAKIENVAKSCMQKSKKLQKVAI